MNYPNNFTDSGSLRIEIAILQEDIKSASPGSANFLIPALVSENKNETSYVDNSNIANKSIPIITSVGTTNISNTITLNIPKEYTIYYGKEIIPKGTRFIVCFIGANMNDIKIIGRYDSLPEDEQEPVEPYPIMTENEFYKLKDKEKYGIINVIKNKDSIYPTQIYTKNYIDKPQPIFYSGLSIHQNKEGLIVSASYEDYDEKNKIWRNRVDGSNIKICGSPKIKYGGICFDTHMSNGKNYAIIDPENKNGDNFTIYMVYKVIHPQFKTTDYENKALLSFDYDLYEGNARQYYSSTEYQPIISYCDDRKLYSDKYSDFYVDDAYMIKAIRYYYDISYDNNYNSNPYKYDIFSYAILYSSYDYKNMSNIVKDTESSFLLPPKYPIYIGKINRYDFTGKAYADSNEITDGDLVVKYIAVYNHEHTMSQMSKIFKEISNYYELDWRVTL